MRLNPETTDVEGAEAIATVAGNTICRKSLCREGLPGALLTSRLKGQPWNRRDPEATADWSRRAQRSEGEP